MIGAIVKEDIVKNLIVLNENQLSELSAALHCEIVDAKPYGLVVGDLRTKLGWTRNIGGEQVLLTLLEGENYDSYSIIAEKNAELTETLNELNKQIDNIETTSASSAVSEALDILTGAIDEEGEKE